MIVPAAIDDGATPLHSEELQDGQPFGDVRVVDPFKHPPAAVNEPATARSGPQARNFAARTSTRAVKAGARSGAPAIGRTL